MTSTKINNLSKRNKSIYIGNGYPVRLMAAINLSSESFYKKSTVDWSNPKVLQKRFALVIKQGCEIIDLGPKSTAPLSIYGRVTEISPKEEINRLKIPLKILDEYFSDTLISVDTQSSEVAEYALTHGADIINDISGLKNDKILSKVIARYNGSVIIMACESKPGDVFRKEDVIKSLQQSKKIAVDSGISSNHVVMDPGIGGWVQERTPDDDFKLIIETPDIKKQLNLPALLALSRKSFIGKVLKLDPSKRLTGSLSAAAISVLYGANIIRTHDVLETRHAIRIAEKFKQFI